MPNNENDNSNNIKVISSTITTESLVIKQTKEQNNSHKGEICHSKTTGEDEKRLDLDHLKPELKSKIQEELEKSHREQLILLKDNKENIIDFLLDNKDSIRIEDLKSYGPIYKCYRKKGKCDLCNSLSNIICISCSNYNNEFWLCTNHWQQHTMYKH